MPSQQPPGEFKTINIYKKKIANGFTTTSWRIQNHKYLNKKFANGFTTTSWRMQHNQYFTKKMRKGLHNNLL